MAMAYTKLQLFFKSEQRHLVRQFYAKILSQVLFWPAKKIFTQKQLWLSKQIHQQFSVLNVRTEELVGREGGENIFATIFLHP